MTPISHRFQEVKWGSFIAFWGISQTDQIIRGQVIELTQFDKIIDFQLSSTCLNMVIALLRFV